MKLRFKKLFIPLTIFLSIIAVGCLKDKAYDNGEIQSVHGGAIKVIGIGLTVSDPSNFLVISLDASANDTTINLIPVTLGATQVAQQDIHVTLALDSTLVDDYDSTNGGNYQTPSSSIYTILNNGVVTIPKGATVGYLQIKFKPNNFISAPYAMGFKITKIAESGYTIANLNAGVVAIGVKNQWEGDYTVTGWFFHPSAGRAISTVKHLSTVSGIRLQGGVGDLGTPFQFDVVNNQLVNWSSGGFTSSGFMSADNPGGTNYTNASNGGFLPGDATFNKTIYNNTYDPATKTFYMHYGYRNGASVDQTGYTRQVYEKWVRK